MIIMTVSEVLAQTSDCHGFRPNTHIVAVARTRASASLDRGLIVHSNFSGFLKRWEVLSGAEHSPAMLRK
jgi:hypothetical protein